MYLVKYQRSPYYHIIYFKDGRRTSKSTKKKTKSEALRVLSDLQKHLEIKPTVRSIKLNTFRNEYTDFISAYSDSYLRSVNLAFNQLMIYSGNVELKKIDYRTAEKFLYEVFNRAKYSAFMYQRNLKAAFNKAIAWEYVLDNPFRKVKLPKIPKKLPQFISETELRSLVVVAEKEFMKDIIQVGFYTGLRLGELLNLKWKAVNFNNNYIVVENSYQYTTKSKKERIIPINSVVLGILKKNIPTIINIEQDNFIFGKSRRVKFNENYISKLFKKYAREANLDEEIHFHSLRHSFASNLVQRGASIYVVKDLLGHEDIKTTQIYSHLQKDNLFEAIKLLDCNL